MLKIRGRGVRRLVLALSFCILTSAASATMPSTDPWGGPEEKRNQLLQLLLRNIIFVNLMVVKRRGPACVDVDVVVAFSGALCSL